MLVPNIRIITLTSILVADEEAKSPTKRLLDPPLPIKRDYTILSKPAIDPQGTLTRN